MNYQEMKEINRGLMNAFPIAFAFSNEQLKEAKAKLGAIENSELLNVCHGWFIKKTDKNAFLEMCETMKKNRDEVLSNDESLIEALVYELNNHEYVYSRDSSEALDTLGLSPSCERVQRLLAVAISQAVHYE